MNKLKRLWQHWLSPRWLVQRRFPSADLQRIARNISVSEQNHLGQIRFVVESRYPATAVLEGLSTRNRAWQWFGQLGVWNTEHNSGVLVYLSYADRKVEIVADRGIATKVSDEQWQSVCQSMSHFFSNEQFIEGLERGLLDVNTILAQNFPRHEAAKVDELPNDVVLN